MRFVTNGKFAIPLVPECKQYSICELAKTHNWEVQEFNNNKLDYILVYRKPYDRIIRGIAADLHEVMLNENIANLNISSWAQVKDVAIPYIKQWFITQGHLPIQKDYVHTEYYTKYLHPTLTQADVIIDVDNIFKLTEYINNKYNLDIGVIPELPADFYEHTVPYWEINRLYRELPEARQLIDKWCLEDLEKLTHLTIANNFLINS